MVLQLNAQKESDFYSLRAETIDGKTFDFSILRGKKVMIVNTASKCGLTPQYEELEQLFRDYSGAGDSAQGKTNVRKDYILAD